LFHYRFLPSCTTLFTTPSNSITSGWSFCCFTSLAMLIPAAVQTQIVEL
jgi:hypothetical protein